MPYTNLLVVDVVVVVVVVVVSECVFDVCISTT